ncbi:probable G-protein coupled receptor 139 [Scyliorhinus canicula]|uniref:probable G-protein coupled receptor 139 n=1 Tax=Scyliorhinus canicula TaxID=7830 RepID=UPI0018F34F37|nr:probable G-protein coupled receptor 139 [Scyliorhinus canicula]
MEILECIKLEQREYITQTLIQNTVDCSKGQIQLAQKMHRPIQWVRKIFYTILAIVGVPVNGVAIVTLFHGNIGLSTCTTRYLVAMAMADLLVIITQVIFNRIIIYYFPISLLSITPVCSVISVLSRGAIDCSVWFTVAFTFDRFVAICWLKLKSKYCTKRTAAVILATTGILLCLKNIPIYFRFKHTFIVYNVPFYCSNKPSYFTDPRWIGFRKFEKILTPLIPFGLILLLNALTINHILVTSRVRKTLRSQSKAENHRDPEMESRKKSIVLLFSISGSFILLWLVYILYIFDAASGLDDDFYTFENIAYMLRDLNCCTNTFIYVTTQSKFREYLKKAVKYPFASIIKLINRGKNGKQLKDPELWSKR